MMAHAKQAGYRAIGITAPSLFLIKLTQKMAALLKPDASYKGGFVAMNHVRSPCHRLTTATNLHSAPEPSSPISYPKARLPWVAQKPSPTG